MAMPGAAAQDPEMEATCWGGECSLPGLDYFCLGMWEEKKKPIILFNLSYYWVNTQLHLELIVSPSRILGRGWEK